MGKAGEVEALTVFRRPIFSPIKARLLFWTYHITVSNEMMKWKQCLPWEQQEWGMIEILWASIQSTAAISAHHTLLEWNEACFEGNTYKHEFSGILTPTYHLSSSVSPTSARGITTLPLKAISSTSLQRRGIHEIILERIPINEIDLQLSLLFIFNLVAMGNRAFSC